MTHNIRWSPAMALFLVLSFCTDLTAANALQASISEPLTIQQKAALFENAAAFEALSRGSLTVDGWGPTQDNPAIGHDHGIEIVIAIFASIFARIFLHESREWRDMIQNVHVRRQVRRLSVTNTGDSIQTFSPQVLMQRFYDAQDKGHQPLPLQEFLSLYDINWRRVMWPLVGIGTAVPALMYAGAHDGGERLAGAGYGVLVGGLSLNVLLRKLLPFLSKRAQIRDRFLPQVVSPQGTRTVLPEKNARTVKLLPGHTLKWNVIADWVGVKEEKENESTNNKGE